MAAGDAYVVAPTSTANNASLTLAQGSGVEVVVHNIYYGGAVEFYWTDGTNPIKFDSDTALGGRLNLQHHCTQTRYISIKNVSGGTIFIGADGMTTR